MFILFRKERTKKSGAKEKIPTRYRRKFLNDLTFASLTKSLLRNIPSTGTPPFFPCANVALHKCITTSNPRCHHEERPRSVSGERRGDLPALVRLFNLRRKVLADFWQVRREIATALQSVASPFTLQSFAMTRSY